jgi:hypothetical protein
VCADPAARSGRPVRRGPRGPVPGGRVVELGRRVDRRRPRRGRRPPRSWRRSSPACCCTPTRATGWRPCRPTPSRTWGSTSPAGGAAADYDGDGDLDVFVTRSTSHSAARGSVGGNALLRNRGDGTLEDVTARAGVDGCVTTGGERGVWGLRHQRVGRRERRRLARPVRRQLRPRRRAGRRAAGGHGPRRPRPPVPQPRRRHVLRRLRAAPALVPGGLDLRRRVLRPRRRRRPRPVRRQRLRRELPEPRVVERGGAASRCATPRSRGSRCR